MSTLAATVQIAPLPRSISASATAHESASAPSGPRLTARRAKCERPAVQTARSHPLDSIVRAHSVELFSLAMRLCRDEAEARDLVQDTLERALRHFDRVQPANPIAWMSSILGNAFIDRCRSRAAGPRMEHMEDAEIEVPQSDRSAGDSEGESLSTRISAEQLRAAIDRLEPEFRSVYLRHAIESRSYQEIAAELGIPLNTVGTRLARARRKLRAILTTLASETSETDERSEP
jgi:RNA polymerase sigma-70 factor (ECF subfamily)